LSGINHILAELIQIGGNTSCSQEQKLNNSIWNKEDLPQQRKEYIFVPNDKKGNKLTSNYTEISMLPTTYKILLNILISTLHM
jgi:hypothetical protein